MLNKYSVMGIDKSLFLNCINKPGLIHQSKYKHNKFIRYAI